MPLYAKLRLGPSDQPNGFTWVELISQLKETPFGRFRVRLLHSDQVIDVYEQQVELKWIDPPKETHVQS